MAGVVPQFDGFQRAIRMPCEALAPDHIVSALKDLLQVGRRRRIEAVLSRRVAGVTLVLEQPYDPHNCAAALRTAEAFGILDVHVIMASGGLRISRRVSAGCKKWVNLYRHRCSESCLLGLKQRGYQLWVACPPRGRGEAARTLPRGDLPAALVFGSERSGVSSVALQLADRRFSLSMFGFTESFNLSVAVALALKPAIENRRRYLGTASDLPRDAVGRLRAAYYARSLPCAPDVLLRYATRSERGKQASPQQRG